MSAHSFLPPSGGKAWSKCAAWPSMNSKYIQEDTEVSKEGTAAHWVAWCVRAGQQITEGMEAPNGVIVTEEMLDCASMLLKVIRDKFPNGGERVEQTLLIRSIHADCFGTPDIWGYDAESGKLTVIDYKFGHRFVDEFENEQGVCYISGAIDELSELFDVPPRDFCKGIDIEFVVVQPRCFYKGEPIRTWTCKGSDIQALVDRLHHAAELTYEATPLATTNGECGDCSGRHVCQVFQHAVYSDIEMSGRSLPLELPPAAASLELHIIERAMERMKGRLTGLQQTVETNIKRGESSPWHSLERSFGRAKWSLPDEQIVTIGKMFGQDLSKPGVLTPNQAVKKGVDEAVIKAYSTVTSTGLKLVSVDSKDISKVFIK